MATYIGSPDEQSEDGQLRSPGAHEYSDVEENTNDSLDIKPPQAKTEQHRQYKKSKDKKSSREHKMKEHGRLQRQRHAGDKERERELRDMRDPRDGREVRYQEVAVRPSKSDYASNYASYEEAKYYHNREKEQYYKHQHNIQFKDRDPKRIDRMERSDRGHTGSRKNSPSHDDKTEALGDKALEDLRNRLLSKKKKHESSEKPGDDYYEHKRGGEKDYYDRKNRPEKSYGRERKEKPMMELIDSPEFSLSKSKHHRSYDEKDMRRAKLLDAEREMAKRKEVAREELEARRIQRREREGGNPNSPSPEPKRKRYASGEDEKYEKHAGYSKTEISDEEEDEEEEEEREQSDQQDVVMVSDHSNAEEEEIEEDSETDSESSTNSEHSEHSEHSDVEVAQISPLSVGHIMKSDRRKRTSSRSPHSKSLSRSQSRSSRSKTRSNSEHSESQESRSRSRSASPVNKPEEPVKEPVIEEPKEEILPAYFPAIQGCRSVEEFQCLNRIEEGTYGVVYRAKDKRTEEIVALKRLKMEKEKEGFPITSLREINTLLKGQHPNIVTVREIVVGSNMDKIFIVMDYVEHDLKSLMETMKHKKQVFLPGEVKCLTQQLIRAVAHLHDNWILHRDLKTSNLLLSHKGILKVGDFGLAREYGSPLKAYTPIVVTLWYRAPELLLGCKEYSTPIDIWSVGCIFAEFLSMSALFPGKSEVDQINRIFKDLGTPNERIWPGYSELPVVQKATFTDYPVSLLRKKFAQLTSELGLDVLQKLLTYDPKQRYTADAALKHNYFKELPLPIDPAMFPTWPAKSELGLKRALASSPKPPSGGGEFKKLGADDGAENAAGFTLSGAGYATYSESRQMAMGPGFSLKF